MIGALDFREMPRGKFGGQSPEDRFMAAKDAYARAMTRGTTSPQELAMLKAEVDSAKEAVNGPAQPPEPPMDEDTRAYRENPGAFLGEMASRAPVRPFEARQPRGRGPSSIFERPTMKRIREQQEAQRIARMPSDLGALDMEALTSPELSQQDSEGMYDQYIEGITPSRMDAIGDYLKHSSGGSRKGPYGSRRNRLYK